MGCHALLQGIFPTQRRKPRLLRLLHWLGGLSLAPPGLDCLSPLQLSGFHRARLELGPGLFRLISIFPLGKYTRTLIVAGSDTLHNHRTGEGSPTKSYISMRERSPWVVRVPGLASGGACGGAGGLHYFWPSAAAVHSARGAPKP